MHICIDCGGKLKLVSKHGRMTWDDDEELWEIPSEVKMATCLDCGLPHEDGFLTAKLQNSIAAQKKVKPSVRLLQLRWIDKSLEWMLQHPKMYGNKCAVWCQTLLYLSMREIVISKGESDKKEQIRDAWTMFKSKHWNDLGSLVYPKNISLEELVTFLRNFCDCWVNL